MVQRLDRFGVPDTLPPFTEKSPAGLSPLQGVAVSDIRNKVIDIIADRLSRDKATITEASNIVADLGADSLDIAEIMMDLEDAFGDPSKRNRCGGC